MDDKVIYPTITEEDLNALIQQKDSGPFLVVFTADWLGEGTIMDIIIENLSKNYSDEIGFFRIDIEQAKDITDRFGIRRLPAMFFFKDGEITGHFSGMMSKKIIEEHLNRLIAS